MPNAVEGPLFPQLHDTRKLLMARGPELARERSHGSRHARLWHAGVVKRVGEVEGFTA
jgi:hypothetical protein